MSVFGLFFGWPAGAVWSNLVASGICAGLVWWRLHRQSARQHVEHLAVVAKNHFDLLAQAEGHHRQQLALARLHHSQQLDRQDAHALSLQAHVSATTRKGGGL